MSQSTWDFESPNKDGNKVEFTKFPEGITRIRVVDVAPNVRWTHWQPKHNRSINCPGKGCPICEIRRQQKANKEQATQAMGRRFAMQIINRETGKLEIMEQGKGFFEDLRDLMQELAQDGLTLADADIKVKRRGTGKDDTSYRLDIGEKSKLTDADEKLIANRVNLDEFFVPHTNEQILRILNGEDWATVMGNQEASSPASEDDEEVSLK